MSLDNFVRALSDESAAGEDIQKAARDFVASTGAGIDDELVQRLRALVENLEPSRAAFAALVCGALIERGHDLSLLYDAVSKRARAFLAGAERAYKACFEKEPALKGDDENEERDLYELFEQTLGALSSEFDDDVVDFRALETLWRPLIVVLCESDVERVGMKDVCDVAESISQYHEGGLWLSRLLRLNEEERFVAIDVANEKGIRGRFSGVADNAQLNMLLMHHMPNGGEARMSDACANVALGLGKQGINENVMFDWNLCGRSSFSAQGFDAKTSKHWIWNEGVPGDIEVHEGERVILVGAASYQRSTQAARRFARLKVTFEFDEMSTQEVRDYLDALL